MTIMRKTTVRYSDCFKRSSLPSLIKNNKRSLTSRKTYLYFKRSFLVLGTKKQNLPSLKPILPQLTAGYSYLLLLRVVVLRKERR